MFLSRVGRPGGPASRGGPTGETATRGTRVAGAMATRRRTQAERRADTRRRLLDATVESLCAHGYNGTTAERIAQSAGVTRGALSYHFPSLDALIGAAMSGLRDRRAADTLGYMSRIRAAQDPVGEILDLLWEQFHDDVFVAMVEVWVAARTSSSLREHVADLQPSLAGWVRLVSSSVLGESEANRAMIELALTMMDTVRGVLMTGLPGEGAVDLEVEWARARRHLHLLATTEMGRHGFTADDLRAALDVGLDRFVDTDVAVGLVARPDAG